MKTEGNKRTEGSGVKAISRGSSLFPSFVSFTQGFFTRTRKLISGISGIDMWAMKSVVMCLSCGKLLTQCKRT